MEGPRSTDQNPHDFYLQDHLNFKESILSNFVVMKNNNRLKFDENSNGNICLSKVNFDRCCGSVIETNFPK